MEGTCLRPILIVIFVSAIFCASSSAESAKDGGAPPALCMGLLSLLFMLPFMLFGGVWLLAICLIILSFIGLVLAIIDVVKREFPDDNSRLLWIIIIIFTGIIGLTIYYFMVVRSGKYPKKTEAPAATEHSGGAER